MQCGGKAFKGYFEVVHPLQLQSAPPCLWLRYALTTACSSTAVFLDSFASLAIDVSSSRDLRMVLASIAVQIVCYICLPAYYRN